MAEVLKTKTAAQWASVFDQYDIPNAAVLDIGEALSQPIVAERGLVRHYEHPIAGRVGVVGSPLKFTGDFDDSTTAPAPLLGQHTTEVLCGLLGYGPQEMQQLVSEGVIRG